MNSNTKRNINLALQRAITIYKDENNNVDILLNLTGNNNSDKIKKLVENFNTPNNCCEIYFAKIEECFTLAQETHIDTLAPALGSVHGLYKGKPNLNFTRMKEISEKLNLPLVLHGGTGIPDEDIIKAIENGISKININTELQLAWNKGVRKYIKENEDVYDPRKIISAGESNIKKCIEDKLHLLRSSNRIG